MSKMLIVEDDYSLELGLRLLFRKEGYEVVFANTLKSAAETLRGSSSMRWYWMCSCRTGKGISLWIR